MPRKLVLLLLSVSFLIGCQSTPDENAVVNRTDGLHESIIAEPMDENEVCRLELPRHWKLKEQKSNDRVIISADLTLEEQLVGNLPILEMRNHSLSQQELEALVEYFSKGEVCYVPQEYTKDIYENVIERIKNLEGFYGSKSTLNRPLAARTVAEKGLELAPTKVKPSKKAEVSFTTRFIDTAYEEAISERTNLPENSDGNIWFEADIGKERKAHIRIENYDSRLGNSSVIQWMEGAGIWNEERVTSTIMAFEQWGYEDSMLLERMNHVKAYFEQEDFGTQLGEAKAQSMLEDLKIEDMSLSKTERILWFSNENYSKGEILVGDPFDMYWSAEPKDAEFGYQYTFSRVIGGLNVISGNSDVAVRSEDMYSPPFPVETIAITVTKTGIKSFLWEGISEELQTITENTKLLSFEKIQQQLTDQIFYRYTGYRQPENDQTTFQFVVNEASLGYTYITAYENPENAWLIPAWRFTVTEAKDGVSFQRLTYLIDALEGKIIVKE